MQTEFRTTNSTASSLPMSLADLAQAVADFEQRRLERGRDKVLVYPGTLESLKAELARSGIDTGALQAVWFQEVPEAKLVLVGARRDVGNVLGDPRSMSEAISMAKAQLAVVHAASRPQSDPE